MASNVDENVGVEVEIRQRHNAPAAEEESCVRKFVRTGIVTPLTVGNPYVSPQDATRHPESDINPGPSHRHWIFSSGGPEIKYSNDGLFASVFFLIFVVILRCIFCIVSLLDVKEPGPLKTLWYIVKAQNLVWYVAVSIVQILLCLRVYGAIRRPSYIRFRITQQYHEAHEHPIFRIVGIAFFGFGTMISYGGVLYDHGNCVSYLPDPAGWHHLGQTLSHFLIIIFMLFQTAFFCYVLRKNYTFDNNPSLRYAFLFIVSNNMISYMYYLMIEGKEAYVETGGPHHDPKPACDKLWGNHQATEALHNIQRYCTPFITEYNLFAFEIMLHLWGSMTIYAIGSREDDGQALLGGGERADHERSGKLEEDNDDEFEWLDDNDMTPSLRREYDLFQLNHNKPFYFWGFTTAFVVVLDVTLLGAYGSFDSMELLLAYITYNVVLKCCLILVTMFGFNLLPYKLLPGLPAFSGTEILFMVCTAGSFLYYTALFCSVLFCMASGCTVYEQAGHNITVADGAGGAFAAMTLVDVILRGMHFWFQTTFIILCMKTKTPTDALQAEVLKCVVVVLGVFNIMTWFKMSFLEIYTDEMRLIGSRMMGPEIWSGFVHFAYPIMIFYHIQCFLLLGNYFLRLVH